MSSFNQDRLENEKNDPTESSSTTYVNVPVMLLSAFFGFGVTYLALQTDHLAWIEGDSRTHVEASAQAGAAAPAADDPATILANGKQIYTTTCQACHQATGQGLPGAFPPLEGSEWVTGSPKRMAAIVLHGLMGEITVKGEKFNSVMPTFQDQLKSEDIAAVITYVRQTFGKTTDVISTALVDEMREETKDQAGPWAGEAALNAHKWE